MASASLPSDILKSPQTLKLSQHLLKLQAHLFLLPPVLPMESLIHRLHGGYSWKAHDPGEMGNPDPCCLFCARNGHMAPGFRCQGLRTGHPGSQGPRGAGHRGHHPSEPLLKREPLCVQDVAPSSRRVQAISPVPVTRSPTNQVG